VTNFVQAAWFVVLREASLMFGGSRIRIRGRNDELEYLSKDTTDWQSRPEIRTAISQINYQHVDLLNFELEIADSSLIAARWLLRAKIDGFLSRPIQM
jgi:hypothetical protein